MYVEGIFLLGNANQGSASTTNENKSPTQKEEIKSEVCVSIYSRGGSLLTTTDNRLSEEQEVLINSTT